MLRVVLQSAAGAEVFSFNAHSPDRAVAVLIASLRDLGELFGGETITVTEAEEDDE